MSRMSSVLRLRRALRGGLRLFGRGARAPRAPRARASSACCSLLQLGERLRVRRDAIAIELGERGDRPRRLAEAPQIRRRQQQPEVARLAELVDFDEARAAARAARRASDCLQRVHPRACLVELSLDLRGVGVDPLQLLALDLPLDLELAQIADAACAPRRQSIGFALQRLQPFGRAPRERLGPRALGQRLGAREGHKGNEGSQRPQNARIRQRKRSRLRAQRESRAPIVP